MHAGDRKHNLAQTKEIPKLFVIHHALLPPSLSTPYTLWRKVSLLQDIPEYMFLRFLKSEKRPKLERVFYFLAPWWKAAHKVPWQGRLLNSRQCLDPPQSFLTKGWCDKAANPQQEETMSHLAC